MDSGESCHNSSCMTSSPVRTIELFENQRFQLSQMDWSCNGLLPTDRNAFSTKDGKFGWSTTDSASEALISRGWSWTESSWLVDNEYPNTDSDGWCYASNFSSFNLSGSAIKGMSHFVRRRRRTRKQEFVVSSTVEGTCDYCDSAYIDLLSDKLLEALTTTSLHENPGEILSYAATNRLKDLLMETLGLASICESMDLKEINVRLDKFMIQVLNKKSAWSQAISIFSGDYDPELLPRRAVELDQFIFPQEERVSLAKILIRKYDSAFEFHCDRKHCGPNCMYAPYYCNYDGCTTVFSLKWKDQHDEVCPFKLVECSRQCGAFVSRRALQAHLEEDCELRPADCPYASIGCHVENLTFQELHNHVEASTQQHLLLVTRRLTEQQAVIQRQCNQIMELEARSTAFATTVSVLEAGVGKARVAIKGLERSIGDKDTQLKSMERLEMKIDREVSSIATEMATTRGGIRTVERICAKNTSRIDALEMRNDGADKTTS